MAQSHGHVDCSRSSTGHHNRPSEEGPTVTSCGLLAALQLKEHGCVLGSPPENTAQGAGPCPLAPSCVCSEALIWAKMSKASFHVGGQGRGVSAAGGTCKSRWLGRPVTFSVQSSPRFYMEALHRTRTSDLSDDKVLKAMPAAMPIHLGRL